MARLQVDQIDSPLGRLTLVVSPEGLCALDFDDCRDRLERSLRARYGAVELDRASNPNGYTSRVRDYFRGKLTALDEIEVDPGGTPFQAMVWMALRRIPPGRTVVYGELAGLLGRPGAARAVGGANARNPVGLVIPCHRLVGADGSPTGYAGGIERKRWLLRHERHYAGADLVGQLSCLLALMPPAEARGIRMQRNRVKPVVTRLGRGPGTTSLADYATSSSSLPLVSGRSAEIAPLVEASGLADPFVELLTDEVLRGGPQERERDARSAKKPF